MPYTEFERAEETRQAFRIVTNRGDYTVVCRQEELMKFQLQYIQDRRDEGMLLQDIKFIWDRTKIVPLSGVR